LIEDTPIFRAQVQLAAPPKEVEAVNTTTVIRRRGNTIEATIEDIHEVVLVKY